jgi:hypothetical protein
MKVVSRSRPCCSVLQQIVMQLTFLEKVAMVQVIKGNKVRNLSAGLQLISFFHVYHLLIQ